MRFARLLFITLALGGGLAVAAVTLPRALEQFRRFSAPTLSVPTTPTPGAAARRKPSDPGPPSDSGGPVIPLSLAQLAGITGAALDQVPDPGAVVPGPSVRNRSASTSRSIEGVVITAA